MYKLTNDDVVIRLNDNARIPTDGGTIDCMDYLDWLSQGNTPEPVDEPVAVIPSSVSRAQARKALAIKSLLSLVQPAIDTIQDPLQRQLVQIDWDDSQTFERDNATLGLLAIALGLTGAQLDELFTLASTL